jgi:hypothetical protein
MYVMQDRRRFLATLSSAGVAGLIGPSNSVANKTSEEYARSAKRAFLVAILFGFFSMVFFLGGLAFVLHVVLRL